MPTPPQLPGPGAGSGAPYPGGLPVGGAMPPPGGDMGGSPLLAALASSLTGGTGQPTDLNVGPGDPEQGMMKLIQMLSLAKAGVGGLAGGSGVPVNPMSGMGPAMGLGS
jgi:hypothetical protein